MNRLIYVFAVGFYVLSTTSYAQEANFNGARNESLARSTVALSNPWALFYNPSGMVYQQKSIMVGYQSKYVPLGINDGAFGFAFPIKNTALGIGATYFGDELLNKSKAIVSVAHKIGKTSLGIKTTYEQKSIQELGSKGIFYIDLGGQMVITNKLTIGMSINNVNMARFDSFELNSPITSVQVGFKYQPHDQLILLAQIEKDINNPAILRMGIEYKVSKAVSLRTGILPSPATAFAGFGFDWQLLQLDLVGTYQQDLGWSGAVSFDIPLSK